MGKEKIQEPKYKILYTGFWTNKEAQKRNKRREQFHLSNSDFTLSQDYSPESRTRYYNDSCLFIYDSITQTSERINKDYFISDRPERTLYKINSLVQLPNGDIIYNDGDIAIVDLKLKKHKLAIKGNFVEFNNCFPNFIRSTLFISGSKLLIDDGQLKEFDFKTKKGKIILENTNGFSLISKLSEEEFLCKQINHKRSYDSHDSLIKFNIRTKESQTLLKDKIIIAGTKFNNEIIVYSSSHHFYYDGLCDLKAFNLSTNNLETLITENGPITSIAILPNESILYSGKFNKHNSNFWDSLNKFIHRYSDIYARGRKGYDLVEFNFKTKEYEIILKEKAPIHCAIPIKL